MQRIFSLYCLFFLALSIPAISQTSGYLVKGQVRDANTGELLIGATVQLGTLKTNTQLDGSFVFKNIQPGTYKISWNYIGYENRDTTIAVTGDVRLRFTTVNVSAGLSHVVVRSKRDAETDAFARKTEKDAVGVMNVVSANAIQQSPDVTIANVLQRVSGVSLDRSTGGEGRYVIIRGMDQRYNYTLVNGIKIPSPDNKFRYVPMDIFPSDLVERVELHKTLSPEMEGDAVGGVVNMVMKNAPANGLYLKASASAGLSQSLLDNGYDKFSVGAINKKSPYQMYGPDYIAKPGDFTRDNYNYTHTSAPVNSYATLAIGNRFLNKKLGVMLGASYQNIYKGYTSIYIPAEPLATDGTFLAKHVNVRQYSSHLTRTGASLKLDYSLSPNHTISLYNLYVNLKEAQARTTADTLVTPPRTIGTGQIWYMGRSKYQDQSIYSSTLQGNHKLGNGLALDWSAVYSKATSHIPDWGEYEYDGGINPDNSVRANIIQNFSRSWWRNSDRDLAGYLNAHYTSSVNSIPYTVSLGGLYRDKQRKNYYDSYTLNPVYTSGGEQQTWVDINNFNWSVQNPKGSPTSANNYTAFEKIKAVYGMVKFKVDNLETIAGVRMENTNQGYNTELPETVEGKSATYNYTDILPTVNFKYTLNGNGNLRLVYFGAVNRPGYFEPVPYSTQGDDFDEHGNFDVKHATAQNVDLRYELYTRSNGQIMIGGFYKHIKDAIEYGFGFTGNQTQTFYMPANYGNARNYGFEAVLEKYIGNFGVRANYTYTKSSISSPKRQPYKDNNSAAQVRIVNEDRPLQGQSAHLANAALLYKNAKSGTEIQFNWQFTGKRIALVSPYYGMDYWMKDAHLFDASAEQKVARHIYVFTKIQNLFNTKYQVYINKQPTNIALMPFQDIPSGKMLSQWNQNGRTYQLGLRFDLNK